MALKRIGKEVVDTSKAAEAVSNTAAPTVERPIPSGFLRFFRDRSLSGNFFPSPLWRVQERIRSPLEKSKSSLFTGELRESASLDRTQED